MIASSHRPMSRDQRELRMQNKTAERAWPLDTENMDWIPTGPGKSFRPLRFAPDGWSELMRLEPGSVVALHRHTGDVHALNLSGSREIIDTWGAVGTQPCIVHIKVTGVVEYLGQDNEVTETASTITQRALYLRWCEQHGRQPARQLISG